MVKDNFDQEEIKRVLLQDDSYDAQLVNISDVKEFPNYDKDKEGTTPKVIFTFKINTKAVGEEKEEEHTIPYYVTAKISKSDNPKYNNSKLYDWLELNKLVEKYTQARKDFEDDKLFTGWMRTVCLTRNYRVQVKSTKNQEYSFVTEVLRAIE